MTPDKTPDKPPDKTIRKLPALLVNQIAAGEVIERPASVVKELVENSLDAGATRIDIVVEDGGRQLVRVSDDGRGIESDQLQLAIAPHATSKLSSSEDLAAIATLGFRGEALASIASVSRLGLTSRIKGDGAGHVIQTSGEDVSAIAPVACAPGTVIEVRDLFFNTPARRKFMRAASTEFGHISEMVMRVAMANPGIAFSLLHGSRKAIEVPSQSPRQRCIALLGRELEEALLAYEYEDLGEKPAKVWGLAGLPAIARATAKFQYVFVNGRPVRDRNLAHAIKEAYRGLMPHDRQPVAVVMIEIDAAAVDVNVHPTKSEVRFREPSRMHGLVLHALRQRLLGSDLTPSAQITQPLSDQAPSPRFTLGEDQPREAQAFVDYFKEMGPQQRGFVYQQVKQAMNDADEPSLPDAPGSAWEQAGDNTTAPPPALREEGVLQVHRSYLVTQDDHGIVIIDQHALHERVMFEQLRQRVLSKTLESQRLLMPAVLPASAKRQAVLADLKPLLDQIGIEAEPIGPESIAVQAFPTLLFDRKVEPDKFMTELLDKAEDGAFDLSSPTASEAALHEVLDMMSCKAAVKAGDPLTQEELLDLLKKREEIERSSNCPHGRPTTLRLSLPDLEKQFGRT